MLALHTTFESTGEDGTGKSKRKLEELDREAAIELCWDVILESVAVYASSNINDFFLLHGVTCAAGFPFIVEAMSSSSFLSAENMWCTHDIGKTLQAILEQYVATLLGVYCVQGLPPLQAGKVEEKLFFGIKCGLTVQSDESKNQLKKDEEWTEVVKRVLERCDRDEHTYKLVHVCGLLRRRRPYTHDLCVLAARNLLKYDFVYTPRCWAEKNRGR